MSRDRVRVANVSSMKHLIFLALALTPAIASADRVYNAVVSGSHDCNKEGDVVLNMAGGRFTLTGACDKVIINGASSSVAIESAKKTVVSGLGNSVDIGAAEKIVVSGADNTVTWRKGLGGERPKVSSSGTGNTVNQVK
jgi:ABC-type Fe3+-hydroxamate transport system substrate-binding protein